MLFLFVCVRLFFVCVGGCITCELLTFLNVFLGYLHLGTFRVFVDKTLTLVFCIAVAFQPLLFNTLLS